MKGEDIANSLRAKLSKLRHDGHITDAEYRAFIKKMNGHDAEIRNRAIDEFAEKLKEQYKHYEETDGEMCEVIYRRIDNVVAQMKGGA